jgi:transcriptional regulator with XRE-family HTH domain
MPIIKGELRVAVNGQVARMRRKTLGLNQADVAEMARSHAGPGVGVDQVTVSRIEAGERVYYRSLLAVAAALGLSLVRLGASARDLAAIAAEEKLRAEMEQLLDAEAILKSESEYRVYARLSGYRNKPTQVAAAVV